MDDSTLAIRAGVNISIGEAYLLVGNGLGAVDASIEANALLEQATQYEKQDMSWQLMMGQAMTVAAAGLLYESIDQGKDIDGAMERLQDVVIVADLPEIHFFLGIGYSELGMSSRAKREFEAFLESPEVLVTFMGKNVMRQQARR